MDRPQAASREDRQRAAGRRSGGQPPIRLPRGVTATPTAAPRRAHNGAGHATCGGDRHVASLRLARSRRQRRTKRHPVRDSTLRTRTEARVRFPRGSATGHCDWTFGRYIEASSSPSWRGRP
eukprot:11002814-Heterocapsa_arctica.AAC.1